MIIRSLRLKNIKSYGAGKDDTGVTIDFQSGVNRIAGRNGHGKSTLIEAIGFALFLAKPSYEETFAIDTYLLRNGTKEGEIDVTFEYKGQVFRIERGLGKASKRRSKIIDLADNSICAEGDAEVSDFLRHHRVIGFNTYGEQFNGMHINQTFTGVVIGQPDASSETS